LISKIIAEFGGKSVRISASGMSILIGLMLVEANTLAEEPISMLDQIRQRPLDPLRARLESIETDLRMRELEFCRKALCPESTSIQVRAVKERPATFPKEFRWPNGGIISIAIGIEREGPADSMASDVGCKSSYNSSIVDFGFPKTSPARYLLDDDLTSIARKGTPENENFRMVESIFFVSVMETHIYKDKQGAMKSIKSVTCAGNPSGVYSSVGPEPIVLGTKLVPSKTN
jgi:hypothetical protein